MKKLTAICLFAITLSMTAKAQKFSVFTNPLSVMEPHHAAVGAGLSYRALPSLEISTELSYLYKGSIVNERFKGMTGYRSINMIKYMVGPNRRTILGTDLRFLHFSFRDTAQFINEKIHDTLHNFGSRTKYDVYGIGIFIGRQFKLTGNGRLLLEYIFGIGAKQRNVRWTNVPAGYDTRTTRRYAFGLSAHYGESEGAVYFPSTARLIYTL